jgi:hypothetical protein
VEVFNEEAEEDEKDDKERLLLKKMMNGEYPDAEIDKLLETFDMNG